MPRQYTRLQLATRARQRANMEKPPLAAPDEQFVTDSELNSLLSQHYTDLYELLVQSSLNYFEAESIVTGTGVEKYSLPANFFGTIAVDYRYTPNLYLPIKEYMPAERTIYENLITGSRFPIAYSVIGVQGALPAVANQLSLLPRLQPDQVVRVRYIPAPIGLEDSDGATDATTIDGVSGWEELIVVKSAIDMLSKEESSTTALERRAAELEARIESAAEIRAWDTPRRVVDVQEMMSSYWWQFAMGASSIP